MSSNSIFPFPFFTPFASLFAVLFFGFKNIHRQIGQFWLPHFLCLLHISPRTERGIVFIKCNIVWTIAVADAFIQMSAGVDQFVGVSAFLTFRIQFVKYFLVDLIKIVVTSPKTFSGIKISFTVITGLPARAGLKVKRTFWVFCRKFGLFFLDGFDILWSLHRTFYSKI